ncbi:glycosyltransferase family 4 protein [Halovenus sp. HT40]|uniref:glycosyltransferase family 4 protein n=1 Tax=Halovenus sp. HT40 TaxID=3126691 RepID=UPI00300EA42A
MTEKLVYVLPEYDPNTGEHLYYEYELLQELNTEFDLKVVVERGSEIEGMNTYIQKTSSSVFRLIETLLVLLSLRIRGYNNIYVHYSYYWGIIGGFVSFLPNTLSLYWNCGEMEEARDSPKSLAGIASQLKSYIGFRLSLYLTDVLVTGTDTMRHYYSDTYNIRLEQIEELPNWVDRDRFDQLGSPEKIRNELGLPSDQQVVLYLHRVAKHKGADRIPEIADHLETKNKDIKLVVVGDGPYYKKLKRRLNDSNLCDSVILKGKVPNNEAIKYYKASDIYILPSRSEGFPRVLLESMAAKCPFVSTNVGGIREISPEDHQKYIVEENNLDNFCDRITYLLENTSERQFLADRGYDHVAQYSDKYVIQRLQEIIEHRK